jgi:hypothetical protein
MSFDISPLSVTKRTAGRKFGSFLLICGTFSADNRDRGEAAAGGAR